MGTSRPVAREEAINGEDQHSVDQVITIITHPWTGVYYKQCLGSGEFPNDDFWFVLMYLSLHTMAFPLIDMRMQSKSEAASSASH